MWWLKERRALLLAPVMAVMCGDSLAPGACGGTPGTPLERGAFACTMRIDGAPVPCTGEWTYSSDEHEHVVRLTGGESWNAVPRARVWARISSEAAPAELVLDEKASISASASTAAGDYAAGSTGPGATGRMHLSALRPPAGTLTATLVPLTTVAGDVGAPAGTTVSLEASF